MRHSVTPEAIAEAERQRAAMAAAARTHDASGALIPPGTATVILSFDGPVDVIALHAALSRMIADGDLRGLPIEAVEAQATTGEPTHEPDTARVILDAAHDHGQQIADDLFATTTTQPTPTPSDGHPAATTALEHLRTRGPASAAQLADTLGITRQKAAVALGTLITSGQAVKDGANYKATGSEL